MLPPAVVEQQAKLGVSAEESKAQRFKRLQARFRDRGGAFVPATSNPLVDILLARTVSGESPSKAHPKDVSAKRLSSCRPRQASPTHKFGPTTIAANSKSKLPASRKRRAKAIEPEADPVTKPPSKRRGTAKGKRKTPDIGSDTEQQLPANTKSKPVSKGKDKQRAASSTSDGNTKTKTKAKAKAKAKTNPREVVEVLVSDDDQTLVEVPHKAKSNPKRNIRYEDDGETDDDAPIVRKLAMARADDSKASGTKAATRVKTERIAGTGSSGKKTLEDEEGRTQDEKRPKTNVKKRLVPRDEDEDEVTAPPTKKGKAANLTSTKPKAAIKPEPTLHPTKDVKNGENSKATGKGKRKGRADLDQDVIEAEEEGDDEQLAKHISKLKKRKKEEDNYDDRPRKVVKFAETGVPHSSSRKLKENQPDKKREHTPKSSAKEEPDEPRPKLATKPPCLAKTLKGPPREVLERIKASAARHLRCVDSEPDELDCLS